MFATQTPLSDVLTLARDTYHPGFGSSASAVVMGRGFLLSRSYDFSAEFSAQAVASTEDLAERIHRQIQIVLVALILMFMVLISIPVSSKIMDAVQSDKPMEVVAETTVTAPSWVEEKYVPLYPMIHKAAKEQDVDPLLLLAMVEQESKGDPNARSYAGAVGLVQLMPATADEVARKMKLGVSRQHSDWRYNPEYNLRAGSWYIKQQLKRFNGSVPLALAAYNAGPGAVIRNGHRIPQNGQTEIYVKKIMGNYVAYKAADRTERQLAFEGQRNTDM